ncbi:cobalt-precorrin-6A reductase [Yoonia vestfoldensis]|uniref:cobalt-precorrin-6A reductase n=1 Tax=Yoonia vestfoldensis TaxID=245188 RepID=UPI00037171F5|nr:cobalt-precorrin-6A reductase [Yoonia vestfoldensis]
MTLLLLAGTTEARAIATALQGQDVMASLAGATRDPAPLPVATHVGGFGGAEGFRDFLSQHHIHAVLDATHPYAARITQRSATVCAELDLPFCQLLRPPWVAGPGDLWTEIASEEEAARHIPQGATVFLGTGRQMLDGFANLTGRRVICRQIDPPEGPFPFQGGEFLVGRPPFSVQDEIALFRRLRVDWLVVKNAGGQASATKLVAARTLRIPVLMIARPAVGNWPQVLSVAAALAWVAEL